MFTYVMLIIIFEMTRSAQSNPIIQVFYVFMGFISPMNFSRFFRFKIAMNTLYWFSFFPRNAFMQSAIFIFASFKSMFSFLKGSLVWFISFSKLIANEIRNIPSRFFPQSLFFITCLTTKFVISGWTNIKYITTNFACFVSSFFIKFSPRNTSFNKSSLFISHLLKTKSASYCLNCYGKAIKRAFGVTVDNELSIA